MSLNWADAERNRLSLAYQLAWHLGQCRLPNRDRLGRVVILGMNGPADVLPGVLAAVDQILHRAPAVGTASSEADRALRRDLVQLFGCALAKYDATVTADVDYDTAHAGLTLAQAAPDEVADLLIERIHAEVARVIPFSWREMLVEMPAEQRGALGLAFQQRVEQQLRTGALTGQTEATALGVLSCLGVGTPSWVALIRQWAEGNADERARAARAIKHCWHDATWQEVVPDLIDAGLDEQTASQLRNGLLLDTIGRALGDVLRPRLDALQPLLNDARPIVREFAIETVQRLNSLRELQF